MRTVLLTFKVRLLFANCEIARKNRHDLKGHWEHVSIVGRYPLWHELEST